MYRWDIAHFVHKGHDNDGKDQRRINSLLLIYIPERVVAQMIHSVGLGLVAN